MPPSLSVVTTIHLRTQRTPVATPVATPAASSPSATAASLRESRTPALEQNSTCAVQGQHRDGVIVAAVLRAAAVAAVVLIGLHPPG